MKREPIIVKASPICEAMTCIQLGRACLPKRTSRMALGYFQKALNLLADAKKPGRRGGQ